MKLIYHNVRFVKKLKSKNILASMMQTIKNLQMRTENYGWERFAQNVIKTELNTTCGAFVLTEKLLVEKTKKNNVEMEHNQKEVIEVEINYLVTILYGLAKALNEREENINEHTDPELIGIYREDCIAISEDFIKIAEQVKIRLGMYIEECNKNGEPVDLDYFRLYKTLNKLTEYAN